MESLILALPSRHSAADLADYLVRYSQYQVTPIKFEPQTVPPEYVVWRGRDRVLQVSDVTHGELAEVLGGTLPRGLDPAEYRSFWLVTIPWTSIRETLSVLIDIEVARQATAVLSPATSPIPLIDVTEDLVKSAWSDL